METERQVTAAVAPEVYTHDQLVGLRKFDPERFWKIVRGALEKHRRYPTAAQALGISITSLKRWSKDDQTLLAGIEMRGPGAPPRNSNSARARGVPEQPRGRKKRARKDRKPSRLSKVYSAAHTLYQPPPSVVDPASVPDEVIREAMQKHRHALPASQELGLSLLDLQERIGRTPALVDGVDLFYAPPFKLGARHKRRVAGQDLWHLRFRDPETWRTTVAEAMSLCLNSQKFYSAAMRQHLLTDVAEYLRVHTEVLRAWWKEDPSLLAELDDKHGVAASATPEKEQGDDHCTACEVPATGS